ncbi:helix-turn-helix domain-containing protein [Streptomyces jumonjinensis]|nr:helix-turn-helix transcriptional regulator [Streptomyces jumonjinensis]
MSDQHHRANGSGANDLGIFLAHWRARMDHRRIPGIDGGRRRLKPGLTQNETAQLAGVSSAWYRELESGSERRFSDEFLHKLAGVLRLDADERSALFRLAGNTPTPWLTAPQGPIGEDLRTIIDRMLPSPAYVSNLVWDVLAHNSPAEDDWFFWVGYERNFMRFAFLYPEAREILVNWEKDWAAPSLAQIRFAIIAHPESVELQQLRDEILDGSPEARELWSSQRNRAHPYGDVRRLRSPEHPGREAEVRITAFSPLANCDLRLVILLLV